MLQLLMLVNTDVCLIFFQYYEDYDFDYDDADDDADEDDCHDDVTRKPCKY